MMEADDFSSQNSVSDIIASHVKMLLLSFEKYYPKHEDPQRQNMWSVNSFVEHKQPFPIKKPFNLLNYHRTKDWKVLSIL